MVPTVTALTRRSQATTSPLLMIRVTPTLASTMGTPFSLALARTARILSTGARAVGRDQQVAGAVQHRNACDLRVPAVVADQHVALSERRGERPGAGAEAVEPPRLVGPLGELHLVVLAADAALGVEVQRAVVDFAAAALGETANSTDDSSVYDAKWFLGARCPDRLAGYRRTAARVRTHPGPPPQLVPSVSVASSSRPPRSGIDQHRAGLHQGKALGADHALGFVGQGRMQRRKRSPLLIALYRYGVP